MLSFTSDYIECAHESILKKLQEINYEEIPGYGSDHYCESAKEKIRKACNCEDADVYFLTGGTQTNSIVIDTLLNNWEGVVAAKTGHIAVHEAGAIEFTGHKVLEIPQHNGKIKATELKDYIKKFWADGDHDHMVFPGMVYISHPTEYGTLYNKRELNEIAAVCKEYSLPLYMDGARLGYGLMAAETDVTLEDIANLCDVFYIGGTKVGALFGEAVVFTGKYRPRHFVTTIKQHGALLAKGWVLGVQFDALFTDNLYQDISKNAIDRAAELKNIFLTRGYQLFIDSPTNQQFIILDNNKLEILREKVKFTIWEPLDEGNTVVRFATSWATTKEKIKELDAILNAIEG